MKILRVLFVLIAFLSFELSAQNKILVVSGGGARGAWGGGVAQNLVQRQNNDYNVIIGTSTGSLMAPLIAVNDFDTLRTMYTSVTNKSIFSVDPFKVSKDGKEANIRGLRAVKRLILGKKTLGETKRLRKLIEKTYHINKYKEIQESESNFIISVANFTNSHTYYFDSRDYYKENDDRYRKMMLDHIWRSSNQPLFMTLDCTDKEEHSFISRDMNNRPFDCGDCWVDAGIRDNIPLLRGIEYALDNSSMNVNDTIHVIINNIDSIDIDNFNSKKILSSVVRTLDILSFDVRFNDVNIPGEIVTDMVADLVPENINVQEDIMNSDAYGQIVIKYYFMPDHVYKNHPLDLYFNKSSMNQIWDQGLDFEGMNDSNIKTEVLSKRIAKLLIDEAVEQDELYLPTLTAGLGSKSK